MTNNANKQTELLGTGKKDSEPVWITGCPRSGTTACFTWLNQSNQFQAVPLKHVQILKTAEHSLRRDHR